MGRLYVPSTPATRGEREPKVEEAPVVEPPTPWVPDALKPDTVALEVPKGNASRDEWAAYALAQEGVTEDDLLDEDGEELGRDALREKFASDTQWG